LHKTLPPAEHASKGVRVGSRRCGGERTFVAMIDGRVAALRFGVKSSGRAGAWAAPNGAGLPLHLLVEGVLGL